MAKRLAGFEAAGYADLPVCIAKTQYSFSADPAVMGAPTGHILPVREVRLLAGAGFVVAVCGDIMTMPGLPRTPAAAGMRLELHSAVQQVGRVVRARAHDRLARAAPLRFRAVPQRRGALHELVAHVLGAALGQRVVRRRRPGRARGGRRGRLGGLGRGRGAPRREQDDHRAPGERAHHPRRPPHPITSAASVPPRAPASASARARRSRCIPLVVARVRDTGTRPAVRRATLADKSR